MLAPLIPGCVTLHKLLGLSEHWPSRLQNAKELKETPPCEAEVRVKYHSVCKGLGLPRGADAFGEWARPSGVGVAKAGG